MRENDYYHFVSEVQSPIKEFVNTIKSCKSQKESNLIKIIEINPQNDIPSPISVIRNRLKDTFDNISRSKTDEQLQNDILLSLQQKQINNNNQINKNDNVNTQINSPLLVINSTKIKKDTINKKTDSNE